MAERILGDKGQLLAEVGVATIRTTIAYDGSKNPVFKIVESTNSSGQTIVKSIDLKTGYTTESL